MTQRILVIKHGALGDIAMALGAFAAIRAHHASAHITVLTKSLYADFMRAMPYFDDVWSDTRPKLWQPRQLLALRTKLRSGQFSRVYDLQTSTRTSSYYRLMGKPEWCGVAPGGRFFHSNPQRIHMHTLDRLPDQLALCGIAPVPAPTFSWVEDTSARFDLPQRFALLMPGGSPHRPAKRWSEASFGVVAQELQALGVTPVLIGTQAEADEIGTIQSLCPTAISLMGKTRFLDLAALGHHASVAVSNDTGPAHVVAIAGCPCVVLFSNESNPDRCAPRGTVSILRAPDLQDLAVAPVMEAVKRHLAEVRPPYDENE